MWNTDWVKVPVVDTIQRVVCATTNRVFVGTPMCARKPSDPSFHSINVNWFLIGRDKDYQTVNLTFTINVSKFAAIISMFPRPLKPCVATSYDEPVSLSWCQGRCTRAI